MSALTGAIALPDPVFGQLLALASAAAFALSNNFISRTRGSGGDKGVLFSILVTMAMSAVLWLALEAFRTPAAAAPTVWAAIGWFLFAGVAAMVFGRTLVFESIRRLGVARSSAVKRLNPFFSVILAAVILSEPVTTHDAAGMVAIALGFALLIAERQRKVAGLQPQSPPIGAYLFGVLGALAYACAYLARKLGLDLGGTPAFGTLVSALAGFGAFVVISVFSARYQGYFRGILAHLDRWVVAAAILVSLGQVLLFAALAFESVSTVVMIASLEIFISILLSVFVFRSEPVPGPKVIAAAVLATFGVILVALK